MIKSMNDVAAYGVAALMFFAFCCMVAGYVILVRQALHSPDRKRMLRLVFLSTRAEQMQELDIRGRRLFALGAAIGTAVFALLFIGIIFLTANKK